VIAKMLLDVRGLSVGVMQGGRSTALVDGASFSVSAGEVMGLVGESGSGKTITCRAMMRLLPSAATQVTAGQVLFEGQDLLALGDDAMRAVRGQRLAMIFQNPLSHLNPVMTIGAQIAEPLRRNQGLSRREAHTEAVDLLRQVGIPDPARRISDYPHQFSGGMRQRAMIAGALACRPALLVADEPTTALDVTVQAQILRLLLDLRDRTGLAIVLITHDLGVVGQTCDRLAVMYGGRVVERGRVAEVLARPRHPYTAGLLASQPGRGVPGTKLPSIPGQPPAPGELTEGCRFRPRCTLAADICASFIPQPHAIADGWISACHRSAETQALEPAA